MKWSDCDRLLGQNNSQLAALVESQQTRQIVAQIAEEVYSGCTRKDRMHSTSQFVIHGEAKQGQHIVLKRS